MPVIISFLRAINVGGNSALPMSVLKEIYGDLGFTDTQTLLQSGQAVFRAKQAPSPKLADKIEQAIEDRQGFRPRVLLRTPAQLHAVVADNPFGAYAKTNPKTLLTYFLERKPAATALEKLRALHTGPEELALIDHTLYVCFPNGVGKSKLTSPRMDKGLGVCGTGRNWDTLLKVIAVASKLET